MAILGSTQTNVTFATEEKTSVSAMMMASTLFFMWGFLTSLNDILVPHLKNIFDLSYFQVMFIQFYFFSAYFLFAIPAGKLVEAIGYKRSMVGGLLTSALGAFLFIPAANVPSFALFLISLVILAAGITVLQVSANPFVSMLGSSQGAASRLNLAQAFNSLGTTIAPYLGGLLILSTAPKTSVEMRKMTAAVLQQYRLHEASSVKLPYLYIGLILMILAVSLALFRFSASTMTTDYRAPGQGDTKLPSIWKQKRLLLCVLGIFFYVGAEVSIGSFLINYFSQPNTGGYTEKAAAGLVSFYWGGMMFGRFAGSAILRRVQAAKLLTIVATGAFLLVVASILTHGQVAVSTILFVGVFNSIMFPTIFTLGIEGLGPLTGEGSGLLISAVIGGALLPLAEGRLADNIGIQHAFVIPALCYLYILGLGVWNQRFARRSTPAIPSLA